MKRALFVALFTAVVFGGTCLAQMGNTPALSPSTPAAAHPSPYNFPGVQYPRIEADNRVTFQFRAPDANKVQVSIVNVPFDMVKGDNGVWTYTTKEAQDLGYHNYWMLVDGAIMLDPGTNAFIGYSHMCNGFEIPDANGGFYELKDVPHGNVLIKNYFAKTINSWRHIFIYTPPDYEKTTARYPVLYLQHGGGEDERVWIEMGRTNLILDNLIAEGKIKPFIVVMETSYMPGQGGPGRGAGAPAGAGRGGAGFGAMGAPGGGAYGQLMVNDMIPWIDSNFRTLADQPHRAMAGLSMGSGVTRQVTLANLDKFSHIGLFSGGAISMDDVNSTPGFKEKVKLVFVSYGSRELGGNRGGGRGPGGPGAVAPAGRGPGAARAGEPNQARGAMAGARGGRMGGGFGGNPQASVEALKKAGINSVFYVSPLTAHEWQTWRRSLREFALLLFRDGSSTSSAPTTAETDQKFVLRVDCGADASYKDKSGNVWAADQELGAGKTWGAVSGSTMDRAGIGITGTDVARIYETERYSMDSYKFTVPNGKYTVRLHFAETFEGITGPGERVFSVSLQGKEVLKDLDPFKTAGGALKPVVKEFKGVPVENGQLVIGFTPNVENPQICGIEILAE